MQLTTHADAGAFLARAEAWLERDEATNNLLLGLAQRLGTQPHAYGEAAPFFAIVAAGAAPVLAALMTPPYPLLVGDARATDEAAHRRLAEGLRAGGWTVPGVNGPAPAAEAFAAVWPARGEVARPVRRLRVFSLTEVVPPAWPPGRFRWAAARDLEVVAAWVAAFHAEATPDDPRPDARRTARAGIEGGTIALWEDGRPVSMAIKMRPTRHGTSVGGVYTPPELRGRGYASACVAALSQALLDSGRRFCTLFTDLSNPTSNHIYRQLGYRPLGDFQAFRFASGA